ncbi:hypothetical protein [Pseudoalteromonas piscicida]|uniref:hypothetical protein n=1 Tax=Pseudoalteromonas piscicida TaxID=43662 RepID=UPI0030A431DC
MYIQSSPYTQLSATNDRNSRQLNSSDKHHDFSSSLEQTKKSNSFMAAAKALQEKNETDTHSPYLTKYYEKAEKLSHEALVGSRNPIGSREYSIEFYREVMTSIIEMPIEVEIDPGEMNQALLFNHLGLDFKEYKSLSVRSELLSMTEQEIEQDGKLLGSDKAKLRTIIEDLQDRLEAAQAALLEGEDITERLQHTKKAIHDSYEQLRLGNASPKDLISAL